MYQIVLDTNVLVAAARSRRGASYALLQTADYIVTWNTRDFARALEYDVKVIRPDEFLALVRA